MDQASVKKLVIQSRPADAGRVEHEILAAVEEAGYSENARFAIRLALDEALSNAIRHGNCNNPELIISIDYRITLSSVHITICDQGCGFKVNKVPDPTLDENLERPNGRGIMLMKAYMSEVHFSPCGNCVTMIKYRDCPLPAGG